MLFRIPELSLLYDYGNTSIVACGDQPALIQFYPAYLSLMYDEVVDRLYVSTIQC